MVQAHQYVPLVGQALHRDLEIFSPLSGLCYVLADVVMSGASYPAARGLLQTGKQGAERGRGPAAAIPLLYQCVNVRSDRPVKSRLGMQARSEDIPWWKKATAQSESEYRVFGI